MQPDLTPEQREIHDRLAGTWVTTPHGRLLMGVEQPEWCEWLAPVVAQLLADERERIAREIEAERDVEERKPFTPYSSGKFDGLHHAARIARGQS